MTDSNTLFDDAPAWTWQQEWWHMPAFHPQSGLPEHSIRINFRSQDDFDAFRRQTGLRLTERTQSSWYPQAPPSESIGWIYDGAPADTRYPVCIPSKGRAAHQTTGALLERFGVTHRFFVEETEADAYRQAVGESRMVVMPFHDLGQGSIPARNFIWEWAQTHQHARHWVMDDNIRHFVRCTNNRKVRIRGGRVMQAMEDFVDRYENVALAGPHNRGFIYAGNPSLSAFLLNSRVYSCILIDTSLPHRWRGRYNEDTDLSLRVLKDGYCTVLFRTFLMEKMNTSRGDGTKTGGLPGGNTDHVYNTGDYRRAFAESLREQHPDCVNVVWRYNRWHHDVDYTRFSGNVLKRKPDVVPIALENEYGMTLKRLSCTDQDVQDIDVVLNAESESESETEVETLDL